MKAMTKVAEINVATELDSTHNYVQTYALNDATEILVLLSGVQNGTSTASAMGLTINTTWLGALIPSQKSGTSVTQYINLRWNGYGWIILRPDGYSSSSAATTFATGKVLYGIKNVGKASSIKISNDNATYRANAGTITIWAR